MQGRQRTYEAADVTLNANLNLSVNATGNLGFVIPTYVFETPVLGGQASVSMIAAYGVVGTTLAGTLSGVLTTPFGNVPFARSDTISDTTWGFGDLIPQFALRWNAGVHNYMVYATGDIPVGAYQSNRLSNIGIGHGAIDAGGGYTYFNPQTGHEFSGVLGFTYNFKTRSSHGSRPDTTNSQPTVWRSSSSHQSAFGCALLSPRP